MCYDYAVLCFNWRLYTATVCSPSLLLFSVAFASITTTLKASNIFHTLNLSVSLLYSCFFAFSHSIHPSNTSNTSLSMHVMASTINLIGTFSFCLGQMSGFRKCAFIKCLDLGSTRLFPHATHRLFIWECRLNANILDIQSSIFHHHSECGVSIPREMIFDYMLNALNSLRIIIG